MKTALLVIWVVIIVALRIAAAIALLVSSFTLVFHGFDPEAFKWFVGSVVVMITTNVNVKTD